MKKYFVLKFIILFSLLSFNNTVLSKDFDVGLSISGWGSGIEGNYFFQDEIHFGSSYQSTSTKIDSTGSTVSVTGEITFTTFEVYSRYYLRNLEFSSGFFGQGGLIIRNWKANADYIENSTNSELSSVELKWNPIVLGTGLGWSKVWDNGFSFQSSFIGIWGGKREINYNENMYSISDSDKKNLEDVSNFQSKLNLFFGYAF